MSVNRVSVQIYENLVAMGFQKGAAAEALRQSNNDPNLALEVRLNTVKPLKKELHWVLQLSLESLRIRL